MDASQFLAKVLDEAMGSKRVQVLIAGRDVPHTHIHLIPSESIADVRTAETLSLTPERMHDIQTQILTILEQHR